MTDVPAERLLELEPAIEWNGKTHDVLQLREPTAAEVVKAMDAAGSGADSNHKMLMSLIGSVSGLPRQVVEKLPIRKFNEAGSFLLSMLSAGLETSES